MSVSRLSLKLLRGLACGIGIVTILAAFSPARAEDKIIAASVGGGVVELFWLPQDHSWPAGGWRLERISDGVTESVAELGLGTDGAAMAKLDDAAATAIAEFADKLRRGTLSEAERASADAVFAIAAITNINYGRALGLRFRDTGAPDGMISYRLSALDTQGTAFRTADTNPVDVAAPAPLPHAPENLAAGIGEEGVLISWTDPPEITDAPIAGYQVLRVETGGFTDLTPELHLRTIEEEPVPLTFLDRDAPRDQIFAYDLASIDLFGRSSTPKRLLVTLGDLARAAVPTNLTGEAGPEIASLTWSPVAQAGVTGYVVERSLFIGGPYEAITPEGIPPDSVDYIAAGLAGGTSYFFRIRTFDRDGNLGRASLPVKVVSLAAAPPPAPTSLTADAGPSRVRLAWDGAPEGVAGFFVFRQLDGNAGWKRLNGTVTPEPLFIDRFERGAFSDQTVSYRVQAIGYDSSASAFSETLAVSYGDETLPPPPLITSVTGEDGVAHLTFRPGAPEADTNRFLVLRSDDESRAGLVRGDALPSEAREFTDPDVVPGVAYWFEVVALDAAGNRSALSNRVLSTIAAPSLPIPPAPSATFDSDPFPHVALEVGELPDGLLAVVEARTAGLDKWFTVAGPLAIAGPVNLTNLPEGASEIAYRLVYQAVNGARGAPSPETLVTLQ